MRTMIEKRIGPVPIAVVAALALAAFISAGLWLVPGNGQTAEAQGFTDDPAELCYPEHNDTAGDVDWDNDGTNDLFVPVANQCVVSGDSVTVRFRAEDSDNKYQVFTNGKITGGSDVKLYLDGTASETEDNTAPTTAISHKEVEVPTSGAVLAAKHVDLIISRNGKNPVIVQVIDDDAISNVALGISASDFEIAVTTDDQDETIYFENTARGMPVKARSNLDIADTDKDMDGDQLVDTKKGESGTITATFMDYSSVGTFAGYHNVTTIATSGAVSEVEYQVTDEATDVHTLTVRPKSDQKSQLKAALIPGRYVTFTNNITTSTRTNHGSIDPAAVPTTVIKNTTVQLIGRIITGPREGDSGNFTVTLEATSDVFNAANPDDRKPAVSVQSNDTGVTSVASTPDDDTSGGVNNSLGTTSRRTSITHEGNGTRAVTTVTIAVHSSRALEDGTVTFSVEGAGVKLQAGLAEGTELTASAKDAMSASTGLKVIGLPKNSTDPYRVVVKAAYSGATGSLTLEDDSLNKKGPLDSVTAMACAMDSKNKNADDGCGTGYKPMSTFNPGDKIYVMAKAEDALGTKLSPTTFKVSATSDDKANFGGLDLSGMANVTMGKASITAASSSKGGSFTLTATATLDGVTKSTTVPVIISGPATMIDLTCSPETIPVATGQTRCNVTLTDANGNMPTGLVTKAGASNRSVINVSSRNKDAIYPKTVNVTDKGTASFTVTLSEDAVEGRSYTIIVNFTVDNTVLDDSTTVVYGMAPAMPMNVSAMATSDSAITVRWNAVSGATSYKVERGTMGADGMKSWTPVTTMETGTSYMDSGLMAETTYYYRVTAMNSAGNSEATDGTAVATTQMAPAMVLTAPTGLEAGYLPLTGSISLSWTPGEAAKRQMVVLLDANMNVVFNQTVTADTSVSDIRGDNYGNSLLSGEYKVYVLSISGTAFEYARVSVTVPAN